MTKNEFNDYLNGFKKEPGEYTDEELYEIGVKYKELPTSEKRWDELVKILGPKNDKDECKTGEQFRIWLKGCQYREGTIKKNEKMLSGQTIDNVTFEEFSENIDKQKQELYVEQQRTRDQRNSLRRTLRDEARIETMKDCIKSSISELKNLPEVNCLFDSTTLSGGEAVLLVSDLHIGMYVDNFYNKYNVEIAKKRVKKMVNDTIEMCHKHGISRLNVLNMGDLVTGLIHISSRVEQEEDVVSQVMIASEILSDALNKLQEAAPEVTYRSTLDNHSRVVADKNQHIEKENFGRLIDWYIIERLKDTSIIFPDDNLDENIGFFKLLNGKNVVFVHGHLDNINTIFQNMVGATGEYIDYAFLGHYHSEKLKTFQNCRVIVNGSICGTDSYALSRRLFGSPSQTLIIFEGDNLLDYKIGLNIR